IARPRSRARPRARRAPRRARALRGRARSAAARRGALPRAGPRRACPCRNPRAGAPSRARASSADLFPERAHLGERITAARVGEAPEEHFSVALGDEARVEDGDHAAIAPRADEPPEALLEGERGAREEELAEGVLAARLEARRARLGERIVGRLEGELVHDDEAERAPRHVHALPEARG